MASNEKMAWDIIKDLEPIKEILHELNRILEVKEEKGMTPQMESKRRLVAADYDPLVEAFIRNYMDDTGDKTFGVRFKNRNS